MHDVIIVGGGGSGLAAACRLAELGAKPLVLEKQPHLGGTTGIAVGTFTASNTSLQREKNLHDDPIAHDQDAGKFAPQHEPRNNATLRPFFLREAAATFEWLRGLGLTFHGPNPEPPNRVPRMHNVVPGAKAYIAALQVRILKAGGVIRCGCDVTGLLREGTRVVGVLVREAGQAKELRAERGVILAAGDYANNREMIANNKGKEYAAIEGINPHSHGDGHRLAEQAGGVLVNMDITYGPELRFVPPARKPFQQMLPTSAWAARAMGWIYQRMPKTWQAALIKRLLVTWQHPENKLFDDGAILLNARGERFVDEKSWPAREIAVAQQPGKIAYILLDGRLVERYSAWPNFVSTAPEIAYAYVKDYQQLRPDVTHAGADLVDLKPLAAVADAVRETVARFNAVVSGKRADEWGRTGDRELLQSGGWVLLGPVKAYFTTTEGGARINEQMQVLDANEKPIAGLYAVGQVGLSGMVLFGHGLHIAWALTSGRLAAEAIMKPRND